MEVYLSTSLVALLLTFLDSKKKLPNGMLWGFVLITFVQAIRYGCGNDYMNYYRDFELFTHESLDIIPKAKDYYHIEPGWALINFLFQPLGGFFSLIAAISIIENCIYFHVIKKYVIRPYWSLAFILYAFYTTIGYLINMTMIRQGLVISLFLLAYPIYKNGRIILSILITLLLFTIHQSALVLLPICFLKYLPKNQKLMSLLFLFTFLVFLVSGILLKEILTQMFALQAFTRFESYDETGEAGHLGLGLLLKNTPIIIALYYLFKNNRFDNDERILVVTSSIYALILPFSAYIDLAARAGYYFLGLNVMFYPLILVKTPRFLRSLIVLVLLSLIVFDYLNFFGKDSIYAPYYNNYTTIISKF